MGNVYIDNRGSGNSSGGCVPALLSFIFPGVGQLLKGQVIRAVTHCLVAGVLWFVFLGWIVHLYSAYDASK